MLTYADLLSEPWGRAPSGGSVGRGEDVGGVEEEEVFNRSLRFHVYAYADVG
jgi:hypothetical protein